MVTHTWNSCSDIYPSKVHTHTAVNTHTHTHTHTHHEHTPGAVGSHLCCSARGAVGGLVPCTSVVARDSNTQPFDYESDSLTIRPQLPHYGRHYTNDFKWKTHDHYDDVTAATVPTILGTKNVMCTCVLLWKHVSAPGLHKWYTW